MAKILCLSVLLSVLLSFHVASGDVGWVLSNSGLERVYSLPHDHTSTDLCKALLKVPLGRLHGFSRLIYAHVEVTARLVLVIGRHGLNVHGCAIVDVVIKERSLLFTEAIVHIVADSIIRLLTGPFCERCRSWCRDPNYCLDFSPHPFPVTPSCYSVWRNKPPRVADDEIDLRSQPVCTCREMEDGVSVNLEAMLALKIALGPKEQTYFFCHEKDIGYIFECMRKGKSFNDVQTLASLQVGIVVDRLPKLMVLCPRTANIVLKIECTRITVDMQPGHALLCVRLRISVGCDSSNFTSILTFTVSGCLNLYFNVDCRRELLLLSVSIGSAFRIRGTCTEGEECESEHGALNEIFLDLVTAWCANHLNIILKAGIRLPSLIGYPCDSCERPVYGRRRVYCPCTLRYERK